MELLSPGHLIPLLIIAAVVFFGWKQLPDITRSVGRSLRIFKTEMKGLSEDDKVREEAVGTPVAPVVITKVAPPAPAAAAEPVAPAPSAEPTPEQIAAARAVLAAAGEAAPGGATAAPAAGPVPHVDAAVTDRADTLAR